MTDAVVIGGGVGGASLAARLAQQGRDVILLERDFNPPRMLAGELLQPGGVATLHDLGLGDVLQAIESQPIAGMAVHHGDAWQRLQYPLTGKKLPGVTFHYNDFVSALRRAAEAQGATCYEGTAVDLLRDGRGDCVGVRWRDSAGVERDLCARLVVLATGRTRRLREIAGDLHDERATSYSVGVLVRDVDLPHPGYGHLVVAAPSPVLLYRLDRNHVRVLADIPSHLPRVSDGSMDGYLCGVVAPQLPLSVQASFIAAVRAGQPKAMPNIRSRLTPRTIPGLVVIADALSTRHPLTGGGMTVALSDVRQVDQLLRGVAFNERMSVSKRIRRYYRQRERLASTINLLAGALYDLLRAEGTGGELLRDGLFRYWALGGRAVSGPMGLLSGLSPSPSLLMANYVAVTGMAMTGALRGRRRVPLFAEWRDARSVMHASLRIIGRTCSHHAADLASRRLRLIRRLTT